MIRGPANIFFDDVVAEDDADGPTLGKKFSQPQRLGDSSFAFLVV